MGINAIAANCPIGSPAPSSQNGTENQPNAQGADRATQSRMKPRLKLIFGIKCLYSLYQKS